MPLYLYFMVMWVARMILYDYVGGRYDFMRYDYMVILFME